MAKAVLYKSDKPIVFRTSLKIAPPKIEPLLVAYDDAGFSPEQKKACQKKFDEIFRKKFGDLAKARAARIQKVIDAAEAASGKAADAARKAAIAKSAGAAIAKEIAAWQKEMESLKAECGKALLASSKGTAWEIKKLALSVANIVIAGVTPWGGLLVSIHAAGAAASPGGLVLSLAGAGASLLAIAKSLSEHWQNAEKTKKDVLAEVAKLKKAVAAFEAGGKSYARWDQKIDGWLVPATTSAARLDGHLKELAKYADEAAAEFIEKRAALEALQKKFAGAKGPDADKLKAAIAATRAGIDKARDFRKSLAAVESEAAAARAAFLKVKQGKTIEHLGPALDRLGKAADEIGAAKPYLGSILDSAKSITAAVARK